MWVGGGHDVTLKWVKGVLLTATCPNCRAAWRSVAQCGVVWSSVVTQCNDAVVALAMQGKYVQHVDGCTGVLLGFDEQGLGSQAGGHVVGGAGNLHTVAPCATIAHTHTTCMQRKNELMEKGDKS